MISYNKCWGRTLRIASVAAMLAILLLAGRGNTTATVVGTWQYPKETLTFYENGQFAGNNTEIGVFNGTYTMQGNLLTLNYTFPAVATAQFTFDVSGNTLQLSLQLPPTTYTRVNATPTPTPKPTEPPENIVKTERYDKDLIADTPVIYTFKEPEHRISEIVVTSKENLKDIPIRVEALKDTAKGVSTHAPGAVYKNLNIVVGTTKIKEAVIKFNVENSWLDSNNLASSDVRMIKWDGSKWNTLETTEKNKGGTFTYYEAKTDSFSSFAITSTPPDIEGYVEKELDKLAPGQILFNPSQEMSVGEKERVEVRIAKGFTENLSRGLKGRGEPKIENIRIGTFMKVHLTGDNFEIKPLSDEEQFVSGEGFTQWDYDVVPLESGIQSLELTVTVRIKIPNVGEEKKAYPVFERQINVKVSPAYSTGKFLEINWQWILTTLIGLSAAIIGWIMKKKRKP